MEDDRGNMLPERLTSNITSANTSHSLTKLETWWSNLPPVGRLLISVGGAIALVTPAGYFLSEFRESRGIVDIGYSRLMLSGLWIPLVLMIFMLASLLVRRMLAIGVSIVIATGVVYWLDSWPSAVKTFRNSGYGCTLTETRWKHVEPSAENASDGQLANEVLAISGSINLLARSSIDRPRSCEALQQYETFLRVPAQMVRDEIRKRLSIQDRARAAASNLDAVYADPRDVDDLLEIGSDLLNLSQALGKVKKPQPSETPRKKWMVEPPQG